MINSLTMRVCIQYKEENKVAKYYPGMNEQALLKDALDRFALPLEHWRSYQLILISMNSRITKSDDLDWRSTHSKKWKFKQPS